LEVNINVALSVEFYLFFGNCFGSFMCSLFWRRGELIALEGNSLNLSTGNWMGNWTGNGKEMGDGKRFVEVEEVELDESEANTEASA
jgi:hypothetical protein